MFCPKCGTLLPDGTAFCNNCGSNLGRAQKQQTYNSSNLLGGKTVSWKDSNFVFVALSGLLALISTFLMHSPVVSVWVKGMGADFSASVTLMDAGKFDMEHLYSEVIRFQRMDYDDMLRAKFNLGGQAIGQVIFTILIFAAVAYMFLPYIKGTPLKMQMNILNYAIPLAILVFQLIFFIVAVATNPMGEIFNNYVKPALATMPEEVRMLGIDAGLGLSLDGWLFYLTNLSAIGLLTWQMIASLFKK